jgi:hypothetical protein
VIKIINENKPRYAKCAIFGLIMIDERRLLYLVVAMAVFAAAYAVMVGLVATEIRPTSTDTTRTECLFATSPCNIISTAGSSASMFYHDLS